MYNVKKISAEEFLDLIRAKQTMRIINVSEDPLMHSLPINIEHFAFSELEERIDELDKNMLTILVCAYGEKCFFGAALLQNTYGFSAVRSLSGGFQELKELLEENK